MACKTDQMQRAMDLAHLLYHTKSISAAIKIAMFHKQSILAERLLQYQELVFQKNQDEQNNDSENVEATNNPIGSIGIEDSSRKRSRIIA